MSGDMRLAGKVIVVTGGCTGIGKCIAQRCVAEGASVVINGLQADLGEALLQELGSDNAALHVEDLTRDGCPERLIDLAIQRFGQLSGVVNNAALIAPGDVQTTTVEFFRTMLEINTLAPFRLIQAALPHLGKVGGCVLNIGSVNAYAGQPNLLPYSVSKGALMTMTRNLGDALLRDEGVRVNQINPGWVLTEAEIERKRAEGMPENWPHELPKRLAPTGRILSPEEIAAAAIYWLSDESGAISGQVLDLEQYPLIGRNLPKDRA